MEINPLIFKAYDVRGIYPSEINEEAAYKIGRAFVKFLKKRKPKIVVGQDNRLSSAPLSRALIKGLISEGADVTNIGLSTSPMLYWACAFFKFDGGINITASHNPSEYNGFKFVGKKAVPISIESGLKDIHKFTLKTESKVLKGGKIARKDILKEYIKFNLNFFDLSKIRSRKIVIDTANCVGGILIPELFRALNCKIFHIFKKLDGRFPNHLPNPLIEENLKALKKEVLLKKADFGVAFDGDADRMIFVDEKGESIRGDLITALISKILLSEFHKEKIIYDIRSSNIVPETIQENGGAPICYKIGHSFIKEKMRKENVLFAGELSGHYYYRENFSIESPIFVLLKILEDLGVQDKKISEIISPYKKYYYSGEINFRVKDKEKKIQLLKNRYRGKTLEIDGLRVDFKEWWFLVRPSNTEPLLRMVVEAKTEELMRQKKKELETLIKD